TVGHTKTGETGRPRCISMNASAQARFARNVPLPPRSSPSPPLTRRDAQAACNRTRLRPSSIRYKLANVDDVRTRRESGAQRAPWSETLLTAHLQQLCLSSCGHAPALGHVENAPERCQATPIPSARGVPWAKMHLAARSQWQCLSSRSLAHTFGLVVSAQEPHGPAVSSAKAGGRPESTGLKSSRMGGMSTNESKCARKVPASPLPIARRTRNMPAERVCSRLARPARPHEATSAEIDVRTGENSGAQHVPWDESLHIGILRAQGQRRL
ncbi:hypothetical protein FB107DRAFT_175784, partial [Schizophyllum commune]